MTVEELLGIDGDAVRPPAGWTNSWGATYGGYVATVALHALTRDAPAGQSLSSAHIEFVQALQREPEARLTVQQHRSGRMATAVSATLAQGGDTVAVAVGRTTAPDEQPSRIEVAPPDVGPPEDYAPRVDHDPRMVFIDRDFDLRPALEHGTLTVQWMRLKRLPIGDGEPWPTAALGLVADMAGAGVFKAALLANGGPQATLALNLTIHLATEPRGPWVLGVFHHVALELGRGIGRGELYDRDGRFVAGLTQFALSRPPR